MYRKVIKFSVINNEFRKCQYTLVFKNREHEENNTDLKELNGTLKLM